MLTELFVVFLRVQLPVFILELFVVLSTEEVVGHLIFSLHLHSQALLSISHTFGVDLVRPWDIFLSCFPQLIVILLSI